MRLPPLFGYGFRPFFLAAALAAVLLVPWWAASLELGVPLADHYRHLVVHGFLHLIGYDHRSDGEAARMEALEKKILARLGVANPYSDGVVRE